MNGMFFRVSSFNWEFESVRDMKDMFYEAKSFDQTQISPRVIQQGLKSRNQFGIESDPSGDEDNKMNMEESQKRYF